MQISTLCYTCQKGRLITDHESGEVICSNCGLVLSDKAIEACPEWKNFDNEATNDVIREGALSSLALHDMGLRTNIGKTKKDYAGIVLDTTLCSSISRLRTWQLRIQLHTPSNRSLRQAFYDLHKLKDKLSLSDPIVEKSAYIYRKAHEKRLTRGRSISSVLNACIYIACRELGVPRTLKDICAISGVRRKSTSAACRLLIRELNVKIPVVDPMKCIAKLTNKAGISESTKRCAIDIMNDLIKTEICAGKVPMGFAATIVYISCLNKHEKVTQRAIAEAAGITDVTLRNRLKDLADHGLDLIKA